MFVEEGLIAGVRQMYFSYGIYVHKSCLSSEHSPVIKSREIISVQCIMEPSKYLTVKSDSMK